MRLAVFCFYDKSGIVHNYVIEYLRAIGSVTDAIDVVVNGEIDDDGYERLKDCSRNIYIRDNTGYDAGAYTEYFQKWADPDEISGCDRLILLNDTVLGPFVPVTEIFDQMTSSDYDYWGIRRVDQNAFKYLESYFLVFEKRILKDGALQRFFTENQILMSASYNDVLAIFERGLYAYLKWNGYKSGSYVDMPYYDVYYSADYCIIKRGYPFLKRKCLNTYMYGKLQLDMIIDHIKQTSYDESLIKDYVIQNYDPSYEIGEFSQKDHDEKLDRVVHIPRFEVTEEELIQFFKENPELYIYGAGYYASIFYSVYEPYLNNMSGFVVSKKLNTADSFRDKPIIGASDLPETAAVLIALDRANTKEVIVDLPDFTKSMSLWI